jgi:hypothetical protein
MTALRYHHTNKTMPKRGEVLGMDPAPSRFWRLLKKEKGKDHAR